MLLLKAMVEIVYIYDECKCELLLWAAFRHRGDDR